MSELCIDAARVLADAAVPASAPSMQAYMKTSDPFFGVKKPAIARIARDLAKRYRPATSAEYAERVSSLWAGPHREEKYLALALARRWKEHIQSDQLELYLRLVREGGWWDLVDDVAANLIGAVWQNERQRVTPRAEAWVDDEDMWVRRVALIGQIKHKEATDYARLFDFCQRRAHEKEFFIRKAIGWALRAYSYSEPQRVIEFVRQHDKILSGLSSREALKVIRRRGLIA